MDWSLEDFHFLHIDIHLVIFIGIKLMQLFVTSFERRSASRRWISFDVVIGWCNRWANRVESCRRPISCSIFVYHSPPLPSAIATQRVCQWICKLCFYYNCTIKTVLPFKYKLLLFWIKWALLYNGINDQNPNATFPLDRKIGRTAEGLICGKIYHVEDTE